MNWSRKFNTGEAAFFHIDSPKKVTFYLSEQPVGCYLAVYEGMDSTTCGRLDILPAGTVERAAELSLNWIRGGVLCRLPIWILLPEEGRLPERCPYEENQKSASAVHDRRGAFVIFLKIECQI